MWGFKLNIYFYLLVVGSKRHRKWNAEDTPPNSEFDVGFQGDSQIFILIIFSFLTVESKRKKRITGYKIPLANTKMSPKQTRDNEFTGGIFLNWLYMLLTQLYIVLHIYGAQLYTQQLLRHRLSKKNAYSFSFFLSIQYFIKLSSEAICTQVHIVFLSSEVLKCSFIDNTISVSAEAPIYAEPMWGLMWR